jgi:hypothetical protein
MSSSSKTPVKATRARADVEKASETARQSTQFLGEILWWTLKGSRPTREQLQAAMLKAKFNAAEIDAVFMPPPIEPQSAFTATMSALGALLKTKDERHQGIVYLIKSVWEDDAVIRYAVLQASHKHESMETNSKQPQIFTFDKTGQTIACQSTFLKEEFEAAYNFNLQHYDPSVIRNVITRVMAMFDATLLRENGGVFFMPAKVVDVSNPEEWYPTAQVLDCLENFVADPGLGQCRLHRLAIADTEQSRRGLHGSVELDAIDYIDQMQTEIETLKEEGRTLSNRFCSTRLERIASLRQRLEMYGTLLSSSFDKVSSRMDDLDTMLRQTAAS